MAKKMRGFILLVIIAILVTTGMIIFVERQSDDQSATEQEIVLLFDNWNQALQAGDPHKVAVLYADRSLLLPTLSSKLRVTPKEKEEYFSHFLEKRPSARVDFRQIAIGADMAVDSGLYTFNFAKTGELVKARYSFTYKRDGKRWLIINHHSSLVPEGNNRSD